MIDLNLGSLEPAAIQFTLERLQKSTGPSVILAIFCVSISIGTPESMLYNKSVVKPKY